MPAASMIATAPGGGEPDVIMVFPENDVVSVSKVLAFVW